MSNPTETTFVQLSVRVPKKVHTELTKLAVREGRSMNSEVNRMLRVHLDADKRERAGR